MTYQILDNLESIRFQGGGKEAIIYKWAIREIIIVRDGLLRITVGDSEILLLHADVGLPSTPTPEVLLSLLNEWISNFSPPSI